MITQVVDEDHSNLGVTVEWIESLADRFEELAVIALKTGTYDLPDNVTVYSLKGRETSSRLVKLYWLWKFSLRELGSSDALFIHQGQIYTLLVAPLFRLLFKSVIMWKTHAQLPWTMRIGLWFVSKIVTASKESFPIDTPKREVIGHGINTMRFSVSESARIPMESQPIYAVTAGRISPTKHIEWMLEIVHQFKSNAIDFHLSIVGEPGKPSQRTYQQSLKEQCLELSIDDQVHWKGRLPYYDIDDEIESYDLFLNFSGTGSIDKAVLEAMSLKRPVLTTNDAFSIISGGLDYPIHSASSKISDLVDAVEEWWHMDRESLEKYGTKAREWVVENHSLRHFAKTLRGLYHDLSA